MSMSFLRCLLKGAVFMVLAGCGDQSAEKTFTVGICADYPPYEFQEQGEFKGFEVDLAQLLARELKKTIRFENAPFGILLTMVDNGHVDAALSSLTITPQRQKNFDFSHPYDHEVIAAVFKKETPLRDKEDLNQKRIACQMGSTMEIWAKEHCPQATLTVMDYVPQALEALKAGHVDLVLMDGAQARMFCKKDPSVTSMAVARSQRGSGIAFKKGAALRKAVDDILSQKSIQQEIARLKEKWGL